MNALDSICQTAAIVLANVAWQVALVGVGTTAILRLGRVRRSERGMIRV